MAAVKAKAHRTSWRRTQSQTLPAKPRPAGPRVASGANSVAIREMMAECNASFRSRPFSRAAFRRADHHSLCHWYTSFKLSLRDLLIVMADRGITLTHTTILRWVQRYVPEFEKRWSRYAGPAGGSSFHWG